MAASTSCPPPPFGGFAIPPQALRDLDTRLLICCRPSCRFALFTPRSHVTSHLPPTSQLREATATTDRMPTSCEKRTATSHQQEEAASEKRQRAATATSDMDSEAQRHSDPGRRDQIPTTVSSDPRGEATSRDEAYYENRQRPGARELRETPSDPATHRTSDTATARSPRDQATTTDEQQQQRPSDNHRPSGPAQRISDPTRQSQRSRRPSATATSTQRPNRAKPATATTNHRPSKPATQRPSENQRIALRPSHCPLHYFSTSTHHPPSPHFTPPPSILPLLRFH